MRKIYNKDNKKYEFRTFTGEVKLSYLKHKTVWKGNTMRHYEEDVKEWCTETYSLNGNQYTLDELNKRLKKFTIKHKLDKIFNVNNLLLSEPNFVEVDNNFGVRELDFC